MDRLVPLVRRSALWTVGAASMFAACLLQIRGAGSFDVSAASTPQLAGLLALLVLPCATIASARLVRAAPAR